MTPGKAKSQKKNSNAFCFRLKMIHFRTFSKLALGLINQKTPCHEAILKVQPHWFNAKCDKRIKEEEVQMLRLAKITARALITLFSKENFAQYSLRNKFSSSYVWTNFAQTLQQCRRIVKE